MISERDLDEAIAECQGVRNPDASTCIKLAAFYTIKDAMYSQPQSVSSYSYASAPEAETVINADDTDFARLINGKPQKAVWPVINELIETLRVIQPRVYDAVMKKLY